ncbi:MAG: hypothetical protein EP329_19460 [Deltaproteobacteria bacterium]|nr:MAG: hypothetical protein EP329_19460 [Deltaproteobacteria bacterium]
MINLHLRARSGRWPLYAFLALALAACGSDGGSGGSDTADSGISDTTAGVDTADAVGADTGVPPAEANIEAALDCGTPNRVFGQSAAGELQLHEMDTAAFPNALCNDGTPAVLYFRPYQGEANRNRWAITLRGGGGCGGAASCAARWCSCRTAARCPNATSTTNFTADNMSGGGRRGQAGKGLHLRDDGVDNPLAGYNHVQLIYCSSDSWAGRVRGLTFTTDHPITGEEVSYTLNFLGAEILDADLAVLRQDGAPGLVYTVAGASVALPDLDDAVEVVVAGDSAGGAGVIHNLDHIAATLRTHHTGCDGGASCPPEVVGVIDAVVGPAMERLDFTRSAGAEAGIDSFQKYVDLAAAAPANQGGRVDESCRAWHMAHAPETVSACLDISHVVRNHLTTPFFVRMALLDNLIAGNYEESGVEDPELGPFVRNANGVPVVFGVVLQRELATFPELPDTAEEGDAITVAPGVFAPACSNHDTIHENTEVYGVTIAPEGAGPYLLFDVFRNWRTGGAPSAVLTQDAQRNDTVCPPAQ